MSITDYIRTIPDFPKPGIQYRDITTLLSNPDGLRAAVDEIVGHYSELEITCVAGIEARGFIFGTAVAYKMGLGFIPLRKPGKLPGKTISMAYELEYGEDRLELHSDAIAADAKVLLIDDLIATGGTADAATKLIQSTGAKIAGFCAVVDLPALGGMARLEANGIDCLALCEFEGD
ncbi:MAG: adenine phosphoribosyltransferase [bacterium]|nr:adenine phosphoribosyltransferase [bacterium]